MEFYYFALNLKSNADCKYSQLPQHFNSGQFKWNLCTGERPHAHHPVSQRFHQCFLWNSSSVALIFIIIITMTILHILKADLWVFHWVFHWVFPISTPPLRNPQSSSMVWHPRLWACMRCLRLHNISDLLRLGHFIPWLQCPEQYIHRSLEG